MLFEEASILSEVCGCLASSDVLSFALCCWTIYRGLNRDGLLKVGNVSLGFSPWCQSILYCIDTTSVRRVEIYLDYYVDRVSEAECLIDGLERLTLVAELTLKFNPRRVGSANLATKISTMFSGLSKLNFICGARESNVPPRRALKFSKAESTLKAFDTLARRNKHSLVRLTLRCDPDLR
ncbi:hypothetical protein FOZ62_009515, partial [Perkinsus olseni]